MSKEEAKFRLFSKLEALGFSYSQARELRRIEMTLKRWYEEECGTDKGCIERDEKTGRPYRVIESPSLRGGQIRYAIADKEAGAIRRMERIVANRNDRAYVDGKCVNPVRGVPTCAAIGAALWIVTAESYGEEYKRWLADNSGANPSAFPFPGIEEIYHKKGLPVSC